MGCSTDVCFTLPHHFPANPDIAGLGVILAFLIPGWVSLLISICCSLCHHSFFPPNRVDAILSKYYNSVHQYVKSLIAKATGRQLPDQISPPQLRPALSEAAATLADLQLVTGTAILATAYTQICTLTTYHYSIAYCIALTSFSTFQCTSSVARHLYHERGLLRAWRAVWLFSLVVLLLVAGVFWSGISRYWSRNRHHFYWMNFAYPVHCQWSVPLHEKGAHHGFAPAVDFELLAPVAIGILSSFLRILSFLFPTLDRVHYPLDCILLAPSYLYLWCLQRDTLASQERKSDDKHESQSTTSASTSIFLLVSRALAGFCLTLLTILRSTCMDNIRAFGYLLFCHIQVWFEKLVAQGAIVGNENQWGFGQILPLLLLVVPLFALMSAFKKPVESQAGNEDSYPTDLPTPAVSHESTVRKAKSDMEHMHPLQVFDNRYTLQARLEMLEEELFVGRTFEICVVNLAAAALGGVVYAASFGVAI